jgi:hypothetical protein
VMTTMSESIMKFMPHVLRVSWFIFSLLMTPALAQVAAPDVSASRISVSSSSGNVAAATATATLPASQGRYTYICGFAATGGGATAAAIVNITVTNITGGTMTYTFSASAGVTVTDTPVIVNFTPCIPSATVNSTVVVSLPSLGAGNTNAAVNAWGYQWNLSQ